MIADLTLLRLLQLASSTLPVGAYSYSEGLEVLVQAGTVHDRHSLEHWLTQELRYGAIRLEAAVMIRIHHAAQLGNLEALAHWNQWLSAARETEELREQSWQMGRALVRLLQETQVTPPVQLIPLQSLISACGHPCNFAVAFGLAAAYWQIDCRATASGYLHSWATNLVSAGVRLVPLGQTSGQQLLLDLQPLISETTTTVLELADDDLTSCGWGLAIASMTHETQYSRLFRS